MIQKHVFTPVLTGIKFQSLLYDLKDKRRYWKFKRKHKVALCVELTLEKAMDFLKDRQQNE